MEKLKCKECKTEKLATEFYKHDKKCKECRKLLVRKYRDENSEKVKLYDRERGKLSHRKELCIINTRKRRKDVDGYMSAHGSVAKALRNGKINKEPCCMCGETKLVHAHHDDYMQALNIMWLCVSHHKARHAYLEYINQDTF